MIGRCRGRLGREDGQGMVEFAIILPVFLLLLVGLIEFGSAYSKIISMRQGIREAGRQGSVANWGSNPGCDATLTGVSAGTSADIKQLMCFARDQAGVGSAVRVRIVFADQNVTSPFDIDSSKYVVGNAIVICAIYPLQSLTGIMKPFLDNHFATTKAAFRIEKVSGVTETGGSEAPPTGADWSFCPATGLP